MLTKEQYDALKAKTDLTDVEKASLLEFENASSATKDEHMIPKSRLDEVIKEKKDLADRLAAIEKANHDAEEQRLIEANNYKTLYEQAKAEAEGLKPKASIAEESEKVLQSVLESQIAELPESMRGLVPDMMTNQKLAWLAKNKTLLMKEKPFDIGAGKNGGGNNEDISALSQEQIDLAKRAGISAEEYAKYNK